MLRAVVRAYRPPRSWVAREMSSLRVAVVGAGPAGFYCTKYLMQDVANLKVDMFERLPTPYGLVRSGVAPDHPEVKLVVHDFQKITQDPRFRFLGNVNVGKDVSLAELRKLYDCVLLSYGAESDRPLGIPGQHLPGVHSARTFVNWYNGHPDYHNAKFDLTHPTVVVLGNGNVAVDVARVLVAKPETLASTDIAEHALQALRNSKVTTVHMVARRGPAQSAFTIKELRELTKLEGVDVFIHDRDSVMNLNEASKQEVSSSRATSRKMQLLETLRTSAPTTQQKAIHFHFLLSPTSIESQPHHSSGLPLALHFTPMQLTGPPDKQSCVPLPGAKEFVINAGLCLVSIGYKSVPIEGVPFDAGRAVVASEQGRVEPGLYVSGWIKRGPSGIIGTNIVDAKETVGSILSDLNSGVLKGSDEDAHQAVLDLLAKRNVHVVDLEGWRRIDAEEEKRGIANNKPREKLVTWEELIQHSRPQESSKA